MQQRYVAPDSRLCDSMCSHFDGDGVSQSRWMTAFLGVRTYKNTNNNNQVYLYFYFNFCDSIFFPSFFF